MNKKQLLQNITFGKRIAEEEVAELESYFVETDQWRRIYNGEVDIIYGVKGSGKSAIYSLLLNRRNILREQNVFVVAAEDPRGTPIFKDLVPDPPASEIEFRNLWKVYFLALVGRLLRDEGIIDESSQKVISALEGADLLSKERSLRTLLRTVVDFVRSLARAESLEGGFSFDSNTGIPSGVTGKVTLREPTLAQKKLGLVSVDNLLELANESLQGKGCRIWIALDRLDVAFAESDELEANALRALFRVYLDLNALDNITLKIFLRSDIWRRITNQGFREASHITKYASIVWNKDGLLNLIIRRILNNLDFRLAYSVDRDEVLSSVEDQENLFYRIFPEQVNVGLNKPKTFDWLLSRTSDGKKEPAPRELIHFLSSLRDVQLRKIEIGNPIPQGEVLFDRTAFREALLDVSGVRLMQTLYAENPEMQPWLQKLEREKTQQTVESLEIIWGLNREEIQDLADKLTDIGFFERRPWKRTITYWVPFLYRDALKMVQGVASTSQLVLSSDQDEMIEQEDDNI